MGGRLFSPCWRRDRCDLNMNPRVGRLDVSGAAGGRARARTGGSAGAMVRWRSLNSLGSREEPLSSLEEPNREHSARSLRTTASARREASRPAQASEQSGCDRRRCRLQLCASLTGSRSLCRVAPCK